MAPSPGAAARRTYSAPKDGVRYCANGIGPDVAAQRARSLIAQCAIQAPRVRRLEASFAIPCGLCSGVEPWTGVMAVAATLAINADASLFRG